MTDVHFSSPEGQGGTTPEVIAMQGATAIVMEILSKQPNAICDVNGHFDWPKMLAAIYKVKTQLLSNEPPSEE